MKKTFVLSYLLLAAFIGSAEAKKIDTAYNAGTGGIRRATNPSAKVLNDLNAGIERLLAFYYGPAAESEFIDLSNTSSESASTEEEYEKNLGGRMWFGYNIARLRYAYSFIDQPISVTINTGSTPIQENPFSGNSAEKPYMLNNKPADELYVFNTRPPSFIPPEIVTSKGPEPITFPPPPIAPNPQKPGKDPTLPGPEVELPEIVNPIAPVPEPATMLLFAAGMAGLAIGGAKRNKTPVPRKRDSSQHCRIVG